MEKSLKGKKVVITGITGGIALATAKQMLDLDAEVIVSARTEDKLTRELSKLQGDIYGYVMDLQSESSIKDFFTKVGNFHHLITPAASSTFSPISQLDLSNTRQLLETKQWGQMLCVHHALPYLDQHGTITLFSGTVSQKPLEGATGFAAVGAASEAMGRIWAFELAPIRVNCIVPGVTDTPAWTQLLGSKDAAEAQLRAIGEQLPVGRVGNVDEIADAAAFVVCNGFVNGASIVVDGGHRIT